MYLVLRVNPDGMKRITEVLQDIQDGISRTQDESASAALTLAVATLQDRFLDEGPPQWKELALSTQRQRRARGFDPKHPILRRTGDLMRAITDSSHRLNIHRVRNYKHRTVGLLGTKDPRYLWLHAPDRPDLPSRWIWPAGQQELDLMNDIEDELVDKLVEYTQMAKHKAMGVGSGHGHG